MEPKACDFHQNRSWCLNFQKQIFVYPFRSTVHVYEILKKSIQKLLCLGSTQQDLYQHFQLLFWLLGTWKEVLPLKPKIHLFFGHYNFSFHRIGEKVKNQLWYSDFKIENFSDVISQHQGVNFKLNVRLGISVFNKWSEILLQAKADYSFFFNVSLIN